MTKKKNISLERLIYSLGIRHIGFEGAKLMSLNLKSIRNFIDLLEQKKIDELENLDGIGETQIKSIKNFFKNKTNLLILKDLNKLLQIRDVKALNKKGALKEKTFMLTGKLLNMSRSEAKSLIEQHSGSVISNISKKLDYLIVGEKPTKKKIENAKQLNIKVINQSEWLKLLNKSS